MVDKSIFNRNADWVNFYGDVEEELPPKMPTPRGKRQHTVELATFGSEFVALQTCKDLIVALHYKLGMFGVPIEGPANVFCDNQGVVKNTSIPQSTLLKKHNAINYNAVQEAAVAGILHVGKEDGSTNLSNLLTKVVVGER
eukprot:15232754-Ditylum_brightwellii.AAC.1